MKIILQEPKEEDILYQYEYCAYAISKNFYQNLRFYILPYFPSRLRKKIIFFPEIPSFIKQYKKQKEYHTFTENKSVINDILKTHKYLKDKYQSTIDRKNMELYAYLPKLENNIHEIFKKHQLPNEIIISYSLYGSENSFNTYFKIPKIYPRFDSNINTLLRPCIYCIIKNSKFNNNYVINNVNRWEAFINTAENRLTISKKYDDDINIKAVLKKNNIAKFAHDSAEYCKELGHPIKSILINTRQIKKLTKQEKKIIDLLLRNRNQIVSYDEIGTILWGKNVEIKYSLFAINKTIERVKQKIQSSNINPNIIQPERGVGYLLYD